MRNLGLWAGFSIVYLTLCTPQSGLHAICDATLKSFEMNVPPLMPLYCISILS